MMIFYINSSIGRHLRNRIVQKYIFSIYAVKKILIEKYLFNSTSFYRNIAILCAKILCLTWALICDTPWVSSFFRDKSTFQKLVQNVFKFFSMFRNIFKICLKQLRNNRKTHFNILVCFSTSSLVNMNQSYKWNVVFDWLNYPQISCQCVSSIKLILFFLHYRINFEGFLIQFLL